MKFFLELLIHPQEPAQTTKQLIKADEVNYESIQIEDRSFGFFR